MKTAEEIIKVQESLKQNYSIEEYNKTIQKLKDKTNNDMEVLAYMADDRYLSPRARLFAVAAMGD